MDGGLEETRAVAGLTGRQTYLIFQSQQHVTLLL